MPKKIPLKPRQTSVYLDSFPDWAVLDLKIRRKLCNKLAEYKRRIKEKGLEFKLTQKQFWDLLFADCFYCGSGAPNVKEYKFNEIDRLSSKEGYTPENCTTACRLCNKLKSDLGFEEFLEHIKRIQAYQEANTVYVEVD